MGTVIHRTVPVKVWVNVDAGIANMVCYLNTIPGCQRTLGEDGAEPYRAAAHGTTI